MKNNGLHIVPITINQANDIIEEYHRHSGRVTGHRFSVACYDLNPNGGVRHLGVAVVGRPVSKEFDFQYTAELNRLCVIPSEEIIKRYGGPAPSNNIHSFIYGHCARAWFEMGGVEMITYTRITENGSSLRASGAIFDGTRKPGNWNSRSKKVHNLDPKHRWKWVNHKHPRLQLVGGING